MFLSVHVCTHTTHPCWFCFSGGSRLTQRVLTVAIQENYNQEPVILASEPMLVAPFAAQCPQEVER